MNLQFSGVKRVYVVRGSASQVADYTRQQQEKNLWTLVATSPDKRESFILDEQDVDKFLKKEYSLDAQCPAEFKGISAAEAIQLFHADFNKYKDSVGKLLYSTRSDQNLFEKIANYFEDRKDHGGPTSEVLCD